MPAGGRASASGRGVRCLRPRRFGLAFAVATAHAAFLQPHGLPTRSRRKYSCAADNGGPRDLNLGDPRRWRGISARPSPCTIRRTVNISCVPEPLRAITTPLSIWMRFFALEICNARRPCRRSRTWEFRFMLVCSASLINCWLMSLSSRGGFAVCRFSQVSAYSLPARRRTLQPAASRAGQVSTSSRPHAAVFVAARSSWFPSSTGGTSRPRYFSVACMQPSRRSSDENEPSGSTAGRSARPARAGSPSRSQPATRRHSDVVPRALIAGGSGEPTARPERLQSSTSRRVASSLAVC